MMKVSIHVWVNEEDWERFKDFCLKKHKKLHQTLGEELSRAIRHYLECECAASPSPTSVPFSAEEHGDGEHTGPHVDPRLLRELEAIVAEIARDFDEGGQIPRPVLEAKVVRALGPCGRKKIGDRITWLTAFGVIEQDPQFPVGKVYIVRRLSLWTVGTHGGPDPAGGLRGEWRGAHRLQV
jgi:hypothetical protein